MSVKTIQTSADWAEWCGTFSAVIRSLVGDDELHTPSDIARDIARETIARYDQALGRETA